MPRQRCAYTSVPLLLVILINAVNGATRYSIELKSRTEDCFMEEMHARSTANRMLFRYNLIQPASYDSVDVRIRSPHGRDLQTWNDSKNGHYVETVRENGLYMFCFRKTQQSSKVVKLYYHVDFLNAGSKTLTAYPNSIGTLTKAEPAKLENTYLKVGSSFDNVGVFDFDLHDVSASIMHENTRVMIQLSVDFSAEDSQEVILTEIPVKEFKRPLSYNSMQNFISKVADESIHASDYDEAVTGQGMYFDVTDLIEDALEDNHEYVSFMIHSKAQGEVKIAALSNNAPDHWPTLVFEDMGVETMHEIGYFKETIFNLQSEIAYIIQNERISRDVVESTNSRVKFASILINLCLVGIGLGQIVYVRNLLETESF